MASSDPPQAVMARTARSGRKALVRVFMLV
jgi:hypothetical protein